jgi:ATP-binding cassette subfamily C protein
MRGVLGIFFATKARIRWTVLALLLLAGLAEGIGLTSLLPLLSLSGGGTDSGSSPASQMVFDALGRLGLPIEIETLILIVLAGIVLKSGLTILAMRHVGYAAADVATELRTKLIDNLLRAKWSFFVSQPVGRMANAVSFEAARSAQAFVLAVQFVAAIVQCSVYVLVALFLSWQLALAALLLGGLIALLLGSLVRTAKKAGRRQTRRTQELVTHLSDALIGIKPLKAMGRQGHFAQLFDDKISDLRQALRRQTLSTQMIRGLQEPILTFCLVIGFYLAVRYWSIPISELLVIGLLLQRTVSRMNRIQKLLQEGSIVESAYWAIHNLVDESSQQREVMHGTRQPSLTRGCSMHDISFAFGDKQVLQGVSIEVPANQVTVIMGASGVGKTTLTDLLLGLYRPDQGEILIDGVSLEEIDLQAWRAMVGYVPQELILFHDTVLANVTLGDESLSLEQARAALEAADAWDFVAALPEGIMNVVGERGAKLSGGQRQRIALARALVHKPSLVILDEVTSALDPETEAEICRNIRNLSSSLTILAITHRPAWVEAADRVYELGDDRFAVIPESEPQATSL